MLLIHTFSVLSLQLKKLRRHNKSAIDLSNANPACGHKEVLRSTGHIVKIQLWNLGFVDAYENSILRRQGLSTYKTYGGTICFSPRRSDSRSESKAEDSVVTSRDKKGC